MNSNPTYIYPVDFASPAYDETIALRMKILRTPLGLDFTIADLSREYLDIHLTAYNSNFDLLACLVLQDLGDGVIKMRQVAVDSSLQGKGVGTELVKASEVLARKHGFQKMVLNARATAIPFYKRLNYQKLGDEFIEVNIPHYKMSKALID